MFQNLSDRLGGVFSRLRGKGALKEADVDEAMREIRVALLEADVALPVVKQFVANVREQAVGQEEMQAAGLMRLTGEVAAQFGDAPDGLTLETVDRLISGDMLDEVDGEA